MYELFYMCEQVDGPRITHEGGYTQHDMFSERHWPTCTCKAYQFARSSESFGGRAVKPLCKHILRAQENACNWHQQYSDEPMTEKGVCPRCGGPAILVRCAV